MTMNEKLNLWLQIEHVEASLRRGDALVARKSDKLAYYYGRLHTIEDMLKELNK